MEKGTRITHTSSGAIIEITGTTSKTITGKYITTGTVKGAKVGDTVKTSPTAIGKTYHSTNQ